MAQMPVSTTETWIAGRKFASKIEYVFDTISTEPSAAVCAEAMSSTGGRYACILAIDFPRRDCETDFVMGYTTNGEAYKTGPEALLLPAKLDD
jgi:hypothetical protein